MDEHVRKRMMTMPIYVQGKSLSHTLSVQKTTEKDGERAGNAAREAGAWHAQAAAFEEALGEADKMKHPTKLRGLGEIRSDAHLRMIRGKDAEMGSVAVWGEHQLRLLPDPIFGENATSLMREMQSQGNEGPWDNKGWERVVESSRKLGDLETADVVDWTCKIFETWAPGFDVVHVGANGGDALFWGVTYAGNSMEHVLIGMWHYGGNDGKWHAHLHMCMQIGASGQNCAQDACFGNELDAWQAVRRGSALLVTMQKWCGQVCRRTNRKGTMRELSKQILTCVFFPTFP